MPRPTALALGGRLSRKNREKLQGEWRTVTQSAGRSTLSETHDLFWAATAAAGGDAGADEVWRGTPEPEVGL